MSRIIATVVLLGLASTAPLPASAQAAAGPTLADLAFMSGCWQGEFPGGTTLEEYYTSPSADLMLGVSRYQSGERTVQFEFTRIFTDATGILLLPFPGGEPSEHAFRLTALEGDRATFEAPEHDFPTRIHYAREADGSLTARIDGGSGDERAQAWRMGPVACPSSDG